MKIKIVRPYSADKAVGEIETLYGVDFVVSETSSKESVVVADIADEEAQAMIDAGRAVADEDDEDDDNPTREEMKAFLTEKGVDFPANIKGDKLAELYEAEKAKAE